MFDIGFIELLVCGVIALIVLGPERLPTAARAAGRWAGKARRMVGQFSSELDSQLKADELRKELRKAGDIGLEDVQKSVRGALDEAKSYEHMVLSDEAAPKRKRAPATRKTEDKASDSSFDDAAAEEPLEVEPALTREGDRDKDPSAASNTGHSSPDQPRKDTTDPEDRSPDSRK
jgi:sec-independent protein translocase protein TatB